MKKIFIVFSIVILLFVLVCCGKSAYGLDARKAANDTTLKPYIVDGPYESFLYPLNYAFEPHFNADETLDFTYKLTDGGEYFQADKTDLYVFDYKADGFKLENYELTAVDTFNLKLTFDASEKGLQYFYYTLTIPEECLKEGLAERLPPYIKTASGEFATYSDNNFYITFGYYGVMTDNGFYIEEFYCGKTETPSANISASSIVNNYVKDMLYYGYITEKEANEFKNDFDYHYSTLQEKDYLPSFTLKNSRN